MLYGVGGGGHICCENHKKYTNTLCGKNAEFQYVDVGGTYRTIDI
jgi:hypothetical protein